MNIFDLAKLNLIGYRFAIFFKEGIDANLLDEISVALKQLDLIKDPQTHIYPIPTEILPPDLNIPFLKLSNLEQNIDVSLTRADIYENGLENVFFTEVKKSEWLNKFTSFSKYFINGTKLPRVSRIGLVFSFFDNNHEYSYLKPYLNLPEGRKDKTIDLNIVWSEKMSLADFNTNDIYQLAGAKVKEKKGILILRDLTISLQQDEETKEICEENIIEFLNSAMDYIVKNTIKPHESRPTK